MFIGSFAFLLFKANSVMEYGMAFSNSLMEIASTIFYIVNMTQMSNILKLIEHCEQFIENSESSILAVNLN